MTNNKKTKFIFFPFSHITESMANTLAAFFRQVQFLSLKAPLDSSVKDLITQGVLCPSSPSGHRLSQAGRQLESYIEWAKIHKGNEKNLKSLFREQPYFSEDTDVVNLLTQIRKGSGSSPGEKKKVKENSLLFLEFARLRDMQIQGIDDELLALEKDASSLVAELKGEGQEDYIAQGLGGGPGKDFKVFSDSGLVMTKERIEAWGDLWSEISSRDEGDIIPILVTTSPGVMEYLVSNSDQVINALDKDCIKVHEQGCANRYAWEDHLSRIVGESSAGKQISGTVLPLPGEDDGCPKTGEIKLFVFPEGDMNQLLKISGSKLAVCLIKLNS